jgi:hypothetical protein
MKRLLAGLVAVTTILGGTVSPSGFKVKRFF